jgi:hypothetical protein
MFDLNEVEDTFRIPHPDAVGNEDLKDVFFITRPLTRRENLKLYNRTKKKNGDVSDEFTDDLFVRILIDWEGITQKGSPLPCTEEHKRSLCSKPGLAPLIDYIIEETQKKSRDQLGIEEKN